MSRKEDSENDSDDVTGRGGGADEPSDGAPRGSESDIPADADTRDSPEPDTRADDTNTRRLDELEDELSKKESEIERVRDELGPKLRQKEDEIAELRDQLESRLADHERRLDELRDELRDEIHQRSRSPGGGYSDRLPKAAGVILGVTGIAGVVASLALAAAVLSPALINPFADVTVSGTAVVAGAVGSAAVSVVLVAGGVFSYKMRRWYFVLFAALLCTVFVSPLGIPALLLVALSESRFGSSG